MLARYPSHLTLQVEDTVEALSAEEALQWMRLRAATLRKESGVSHALVYQNERCDGTRAKPRFLTVFETEDPAATLLHLQTPHDHPALRTLGSSSYALLPGLPRQEKAEPGAGLLVGLTNCLDPAREDDFNAWYNTVHSADVIKSPWYWNAQRYRRLSGDLPQFAALYEALSKEPNAFKKYMKWPDRDPAMHPLIANIHIWVFNFLSEL